VFSQHPDDLPPDLRDLVSTRFLFGLSGDAAAAGLAWVGVDPSRPNVDLLEGWAARREPDQNSGGLAPDCLLRDASGRIGHIQIAEAEIEAFRAGFESNPTSVVNQPPRPVVSQPSRPDRSGAT
jgi:hypothetical protein